MMTGLCLTGLKTVVLNKNLCEYVMQLQIACAWGSTALHELF